MTQFSSTTKAFLKSQPTYDATRKLVAQEFADELRSRAKMATELFGSHGDSAKVRLALEGVADFLEEEASN